MNIQAAVKGSDQTAQAGLSLSDRTYHIVGNLMSQLGEVASSIPVQSHTFVEIDHEIISTVILLPSADLFKKGCCQLQAKVCARITG